MLIANPAGHYHFLKGIDPYSCGVIADEGYQIVHVTLANALPWRQGFDRVDAHLKALGYPRTALCAMELRSPAPFSMQGFIDFNQEYCQVLKEWDLYIGELNPLARTNVAPFHNPPAEPVLHAFSYTAPAQTATPTLIVAGAGELLDGILVAEGIIRSGDTSPAAMAEKAAYVMEVMEQRMRGLGADWSQINAVDVYTIHPMDPLIEATILNPMGPAARHGIRWYYTRPPVADIEFEMDMRGICQDLVID